MSYSKSSKREKDVFKIQQEREEVFKIQQEREGRIQNPAREREELLDFVKVNKDVGKSKRWAIRL